MPARFQQFGVALLIVFVGPFFAPFIAWAVRQPFDSEDWILFCILYLFSLAAGTKSILLGAFSLVGAAAGIAIYASTLSDGQMEFMRWAIVIVPVVSTALAHLSERISAHLVRREDFW